MKDKKDRTWARWDGQALNEKVIRGHKGQLNKDPNLNGNTSKTCRNNHHHTEGYKFVLASIRAECTNQRLGKNTVRVIGLYVQMVYRMLDASTRSRSDWRRCRDDCGDAENRPTHTLYWDKTDPKTIKEIWN